MSAALAGVVLKGRRREGLAVWRRVRAQEAQTKGAREEDIVAEGYVGRVGGGCWVMGEA